MPEHNNSRKVPNALPIGYRFNEFEIKEVIGGGGFGLVYRAWDHQLERTIAIKEFMPVSLATRSDNLHLVLRSERFAKAFSAGLTSFIQEARLLARFNHPNLLHVLRFWVQNDTAYMGTLFYNGTTLSQLQAQELGLIDESWIRQMLPMLFGAIRTIHQAGYLHRDISPENIQITEDGLPILLDFGSARRTIGSLEDETETMLRPGYAPIEQYTDDMDSESEQGPWTDIYALGAVLHTLIVGSPPPVSVVRSIQDSYQPLSERKPAGYSAQLLSAVDKALSLAMDQRPQSIDEFASLIEMPVSTNNDVLPVKQPGTMLAVIEEDTDHPLWQRYKVPVMIAGGVVLGMIIGGVLFSSHQSSQPAPPEKARVQPSTQNTTHADDTPSQAAAVKPAPTAKAIARVYLPLQAGETLTVNGQATPVERDNNGFAQLMLPAGRAVLVITQGSHKRTHTLEISQPGTWLVSNQ